jgi:hypothetical protein
LVPPALANERVRRRAVAKNLLEVALERFRLLALRRPLPRLEPAARRHGQRLLVPESGIRLPRLAALTEQASKLSDRPRNTLSFFLHFIDLVSQRLLKVVSS